MSEIWDDFLSTRLSRLDAAARPIFEPQGGTMARVAAIQAAQELITEYHSDDWHPTRVLVARLRLREASLLAAIDEDELALGKLAELAAAAVTDDELGEASADAHLGRARLLWALRRQGEAFVELRELISRIAGHSHPGTRYTHALAQHTLIGWISETTGPDDAAAGRLRITQACQELVRDHCSSDNPPEVFYVIQALRQQSDQLRLEVEELLQQGQEESARMLELRIPVLADDAWLRYYELSDAEVQAALAGLLLESRQHLGPIQARPNAEKILAAYSWSDAPELAPELAWALSVRAEAQWAANDPEAAEATLRELQQRFAGSADERVRDSLLFATGELATLAEADGRTGEAISLLQGQLDWLRRTYPDAEASTGVRRRVARALDRAADLYAEQLPPEVADGLDGANGAELAASDGPRSSQLPQVAVEQEYAAAVDLLVGQFAADESALVRAIVAQALLDLSIRQSRRHHLDEAEAGYRRLLGLFDQDPDTEQQLATGAMNLGFLLMARRADYAAALEVYDAAIKRHSQATSPELRDVISKIASSRLVCANLMTEVGQSVSYGDYEDFSAADQAALQDLKQQVIAADEAGADERAIELCDQILERIESPHPELRRRCLDALTRKAHHLHRLGRHEQALALNEEAIARYGDALEMSFQKDIAYAMLNRAFNLDKLGRHEAEAEAYTELLERFGDSNVRYLKQRVASARHCLGVTLDDLGRTAEAEAVYRDSIRIDLPTTDPELRLRGVRSAVNLSVQLRKDERHLEALQVAKDAIAAIGQRSDSRFRTQLGHARLATARAYRALNEAQPAIEAYQAALALEPAALSASLRRKASEELQALQDSLPPGSLRERLRRWILARAADRAVR